MSHLLFPPTREAALERLRSFIPNAGARYTQGRNTDTGPDSPSATSRLSPYLRRRIITEEQIITAVLAAHLLQAAEKFVQEVLWRTYWKGWLELRPSVWARFLTARDCAAVVDARALTDAEAGRTGIEGFDDWAQELRETGYLHNHARMWFASIWIFTLRLPWALGADFFLRHLLDADPASNTLSWRWVAGLQTAGKTYLATADNISRFTNGRYAPKGLAREAIALTEPPLEPAQPLRVFRSSHRATPALLLVTDEDMYPEFLLDHRLAIRAATLVVDQNLHSGDSVRAFVASAANDLATRLRGVLDDRVTVTGQLDAPTVINAANAAGVDRIVTAYAPVGPLADRLADVTAAVAKEGIVLEWVRRDWDARFWPHAGKGFFAFKERIPTILGELGC